MGTKQSFARDLRASILQAAIQGRLTSREAGDGDAHDLLGEIKKEKEKLIKEKKIKKQKPLPPIAEDEIPFDIPDNWCWVRLDDICEYIQRGRSPVYSPIKKCPVVAQKCNQWSGFSIEKAKFIDPDTIARYGEERFLQDDDLLWNSTGLGTLGRMAIYKEALNPYGIAVADSHVTVIRAVKDKVLAEYLFDYFSGPAVQSVIEDQADGTTKQKELATLTVRSYLVPLPPLSEQKRIVEKVDRLMKEMDGLEEAEQALTALKKGFPADLRASILQAAIQGRLTTREAGDGDARALLGEIRKEKAKLIKEKKIKKQKPLPPIAEDEIPFDIPDNWCWVRLGVIAQSIQYGYSAPALEKGVIKMVRISDIQNGHVVWGKVPFCKIDEKEINSYLLQKDDILFARTGGTVGKSFLVNDIPERAIYAGYLIRTRYGAMLSPKYLKYFMESPLYWEQLASGIIATAQPNCNGTKLAKMLVPLPPLSEQKRIVEKVDLLMKEVDSLLAAGT